MTPVEQIIIEEMDTVNLDTTKEIRKFIFETARFLETSYARALELSYKLVEYY